MILAIEATDSAGSLALADEDRILELSYEDSDRTHSERIMPRIDELLGKREIGYEEIDTIAVAIGPGSFTAIRLAVTTAKTFAMVCDSNTVGVSSLRLLAEYVADPTKKIRSVIDARRGEFYTQVYRNKNGEVESLDEPDLLSSEELKESLNSGESTTVVMRERDQELDLNTESNEVIRYNPLLAQPLAFPLIGVARDRSRSSDFDDTDQLSPKYIRKSDARKN